MTIITGSSSVLPRVVILTAVPVEYKAVREFLTQLTTEEHPLGKMYKRGRFECAEGGWDVLLAEIGQGNANAASEAQRAISHFQPQVALFVGIAGGIKDVALGDVVVATEVHGYESGKETESFQPRPTSRVCAYRLVERARMEASNKDWLKVAKPESNRREPEVLLGHVASGEKLVTSTDSQTSEILHAMYGHCIAVEMEGFGFLCAVHSHSGVEALVIRGISDLRHDKEAGHDRLWQPIAAHNAAAFAFCLLSNNPVRAAPSPRLEYADQQVIEDVKGIRGIIEADVSESVKAELAEAKQLVEKHQYPEAKILLDRLKGRRWDRLDGKQKCELLTNLGRIYVREEKYEEGARLLLEAKTYDPENEKALANEVVAHQLLGEIENAFRLAATLKQQSPDSARIVSLWIESCPDEMPFAEIESEIPESLKGQGDVLTALALRAVRKEDWERAARYSEFATAATPGEPFPWLLRGQSLLARAIEEAVERYGDEEYAERELVVFIEDCLTKAVDLGAAQHDKRVLARGYRLRHLTRTLLGNHADAKRDLRDFERLRPDDPYTLFQRAKDELEQKDFAAAITSLRAALAKDDQPVYRCALAEALSQRNQGEDTKEAMALVDQVLFKDPQVSPRLNMDFGPVALRVYRAEGRLEELYKKSRQVITDDPTNAFSHILSGWTLASLGRETEAVGAAEAAHGLISDETPRHVIRHVAELLSRLKCYERALPLWQRLFNPSQYGSDAKHLIASAYAIGRHDVVLEASRRLREAGVYDETLFRNEIALLQQYDPMEAVRVLEERIASHPNEYLPLVMLAFIGIQLYRKDCLRLTPDKIPSPKDVDPYTGFCITLALRASGHPDEALDFAYELLRLNYNDPDARKAYIGVLLPAISVGFDGPEPAPRDYERVEAGCAVSYCDDWEGRERWVVIEDKGEAKPELKEVSPDHPLARALLSKSKGDTVKLSTAPYEREVSIKRILSKYVFRWQALLEESQAIPGTERFLSPVQVRKATAPEEEFDFSRLAELMKREHAKKEERKSFYSSNLCPIHYLGGNTFTATIYGAAHSPLRITMCSGNVHERLAAHDCFNTGGRIVVDLTALATLWLLNWESVLRQLKGRLVVSHSAMTTLNNVLDRAKGTETELEPATNGFRVLAHTPEERERSVENLSTLLKMVEECCEPSDCRELAAADPECRKKASHLVGWDGAEAIMIASRKDHVLWTDDVVMSLLAAERNPASHKRIWTHVLSEIMFRSGKIDEETFVTHCATLILCGYRFIGLTAQTMLKACAIAEWNLRVNALDFVFEQFSDNRVDFSTLPRIAAEYLALMYLEPLTHTTRQFFTDRLLAAVVKRDDGWSVINFLLRLIPPAFGLNVIGRDSALSTIRSWLTANRLIGPR